MCWFQIVDVLGGSRSPVLFADVNDAGFTPLPPSYALKSIGYHTYYKISSRLIQTINGPERYHFHYQALKSEWHTVFYGRKFVDTVVDRAVDVI